MWLAQQEGCSVKSTIALPNGLSPEMENALNSPTHSCRNGNVKLGYVGHWSSSYQTNQFVDSVMLPIRDQLNANVSFDNTACSGASDPDSLQKHISAVSERSERTLQVLANQCVSIGMWSGMTPGKENFFAEVSSELDAARLPNCNEYQNRGCLGSFQAGKSGQCNDPEGNRQRLYCCGVERTHTRSTGSNRKRRVTQTDYAWRLADECEVDGPSSAHNP